MAVRRLEEKSSIRELNRRRILEKEEIDGLTTTQDRYKSAIKDYRKYANIEDERDITLESIDEWALRQASAKHNIVEHDMKKILMGEDVTIDAAARELDAEAARTSNENQITELLDESLEIAKAKQRRGDTSDFPNILLVSDAGFGKTEIVEQWAKENGINLVQKVLSTMGPEVLTGILTKDSEDPRYATRIGSNEFIRELSKPNTVLFLDEYNRGSHNIRGAILTLVQNHRVWDPNEETGMKFLDNFLFTVAAINPPGPAYKGTSEMDPAERSRFYSLWIDPAPIEHLNYLRRMYKKLIETAETEEKEISYKGQLAIAETILRHPEFYYDTNEEVEEMASDLRWKPLNYRSFTLLLHRSKGKKKNFLRHWNALCNYKKKPLIERILNNYVDVEDKANDALRKETRSEVFKKPDSNMDKLRAKYADLNI